MWNKLYRSPFFIGLVLVLIPITEWSFYHFIVEYLRTQEICCNYYYPGSIVLIFLLILIFAVGAALNAFTFSSLTFSRLLSNAVGSRKLSLIFALVFIIHLSWICDSAYELVFHDQTFCQNALKLGLALVGLILILVAFPKKSKRQKVQPEERKILATGLSSIKVSAFHSSSSAAFFSNLEAFIKPFEMFPRIETIIILQSDNMALKKQDIKLELLKSRPDLHAIFNTYVEALFPESDNKSESLTEANTTSKKQEIVRTMAEPEVSAQIKKLIISNIKYYYPQYENPDGINFIFTDPVDYDDFEQCYRVLDKHLISSEKSTSETILNVSPGTAAVSGVTSILAIKGQRQLVYTKQSDGKLALFETNVWTFGQLVQELANELMD